MERERARLRTARDLGQITGEEWTRLDDLEQYRHRQLVIEIEDEWDRWPRWFAYPIIGAVGLAIWAAIAALVLWLDD